MRFFPELPVGFAGFARRALCLVAALVAARVGLGQELTTLHEVVAVDNTRAATRPHVRFEATVTYFRGYERNLFVANGNDAIFVLTSATPPLLPGDRVQIEGTLAPSFHPLVVAESIRVLHPGLPPKPVKATYDDLVKTKYDCRLVTVRGTVRSADIVLSSDRRSTLLELQAEGGEVDVKVDNDSAEALKPLPGAEVEVTGIASGHFDGKMQPTGVEMHVTSIEDVRVIHGAATDPWAIPLTPLDGILGDIKIVNQSRRVRVQGTITYYLPGTAVVLQSGQRSLWVMTETRGELRIGDVADATGFPTLRNGFLALERAEVENSHKAAPIAPVRADWNTLAQSHNIFDLVSIEGDVVMQVREASTDQYILISGGQLFSAILNHPAAINYVPVPPPPEKQIAIGSHVLITGVCIQEHANPFNAQVPFNLLLRSTDDITVLHKPSLLSVRNLLTALGLSGVVLLAMGLWGWLLKRKVSRQTETLSARIAAEAALERRMKQLETRRSRILEAINGTVPLGKVLEEIAEMTSFRMNGARCWIELESGLRLGSHPPISKEFRPICAAIPGRGDEVLGSICIALAIEDGHIGEAQAASEAEALSVATKLAALAMETRRLYSDLVHRSEFDLLTETHNRFSLEKHLEMRVDEARRTGGAFGLIYIDLNEFKQINDLYGHSVGDHYLQEVARRMQQQLRGSDLLARLGGDEFAVLLPVQVATADVAAIASRLTACFQEPFVLGEITLRGSASIGMALYPDDGLCSRSLLRAADAAMYVAKFSRKQTTEV